MTSKIKTAFIICSVRNVSEEEKKYLENYVENLEKKGYKVHYPPRDTDQNDPTGLYICSRNREAISKSDEIHIYWNPKSEGSLFDFGMTFMSMLFMSDKIVYLINRENLVRTPTKSFTNVLLELDEIYKSGAGVSKSSN